MTEQTPTSLMELERESLTVKSKMTAISVVDQPTYDTAVEARGVAVAWIKGAKEFFDPNIADAHALHKKLLAQKAMVCDPVEATIKNINSALLRFDQEQERLRREAQRQLEEQARKEAEEQRLADAVHMEEQGADKETVDAVLEAPAAPVMAPVAAKTYEASKSVVYADNWSGVCDDLHALVKAVAKDKTKLFMLQVNQTALNQTARSMKETLVDAYPGCRAVNTRGVRTGRG